MTGYRYRAARPDGHLVSGYVEAATEQQATSQLLDRGLHPLDLTRAAPPHAHRPAGLQELAVVFRGVAALTGAGVPVERAIASVEQLAGERLRASLADARRGLREGQPLAHALGRPSGIIPPVVLGMIGAGERGSRLAEALEEAATHLEQEAELVARVRQALAYPLLLATAGAASVAVIATVIVPKFAALLTDLGQTPPLATRLLLGLAGAITHHGVWIGAGSALAAILLLEWYRRPAGRRDLDRALLATPLIGPIRLSLATSRACRALGGLLTSGTPVLAAFDGAREAAADKAVQDRLDRVRERVARGEPIAPSIERERALAPTAIQLLAVGEASGELGVMATRAGALAAGQADRKLHTLVTVLEPALVIAFGAVVAFVALALLQGVYALNPAAL